MARNVSSRRLANARRVRRSLRPRARSNAPTGLTLEDLEQALIAGKILCYAQGFHHDRPPRGASFGWDAATCQPSQGSGARAASSGPRCSNDDGPGTDRGPRPQPDPRPPFFTDELKRRAFPALRKCRVDRPHSTATFASRLSPFGLAWFDAMRTARGTANMIQGAARFLRPARVSDRLDGKDAPPRALGAREPSKNFRQDFWTVSAAAKAYPVSPGTSRVGTTVTSCPVTRP